MLRRRQFVARNVSPHAGRTLKSVENPRAPSPKIFLRVRQHERRAYDLLELYDEYVSMLRCRTWRHCLVDALRTLNPLVPFVTLPMLLLVIVNS